jgi:hypothetical protein
MSESRIPSESPGAIQLFSGTVAEVRSVSARAQGRASGGAVVWVGRPAMTSVRSVEGRAGGDA